LRIPSPNMYICYILICTSLTLEELLYDNDVVLEVTSYTRFFEALYINSIDLSYRQCLRRENYVQMDRFVIRNKKNNSGGEEHPEPSARSGNSDSSHVEIGTTEDTSQNKGKRDEKVYQILILQCLLKSRLNSEKPIPVSIIKSELLRIYM